MSAFSVVTRKFDLKSIAAGLICLVVLGIFLGIGYAAAMEDFLHTYGLSLADSDEEEIDALIKSHRYHGWFLIIYALDFVVVMFCSFVAGKYSKEAPFLNGIVIGIFYIVVFLAGGSVRNEILFALFTVVLVGAASSLGGYLAARGATGTPIT